MVSLWLTNSLSMKCHIEKNPYREHLPIEAPNRHLLRICSNTRCKWRFVWKFSWNRLFVDRKNRMRRRRMLFHVVWVPNSHYSTIKSQFRWQSELVSTKTPAARIPTITWWKIIHFMCNTHHESTFRTTRADRKSGNPKLSIRIGSALTIAQKTRDGLADFRFSHFESLCIYFSISSAQFFRKRSRIAWHCEKR